MKARSQLLTVLIAAFLLVLFPGCSQKEDEPQENQAVEADSSNQTSLTDTVALWDAGQKDAATAKFLSIDWQDASVFEQIPGLSMSEKDFAPLSADDRDRIVQETLDLLSSMRKLFFEIASDAEGLGASGDTAKAAEYLGAIRQYGKSLSGPDRLEIVKLHGKAAVAYAEKKLSELQ
ncbi:MAG: hypothetical protein ACYSWO_13065 [Planctomycetota bacterium]|jgi:hypothetical protein